MDDLCWNCGSLSHHRRDCTEPVNPALRKEIKMAFRKGTGAQRKSEADTVQWNKMLQKKALASSVCLPPVAMLSKEVDRLDQMFYELSLIKNEFPKFIGSVSADCLLEREEQSSEFRNQIQQESENVRSLDALLKAYELESDSGDSILHWKVKNVQESQIKLSNWNHSVLCSLMAARKVLTEVTEAEQEVQQFIHDGMEAFSGRPLQIRTIQSEWKQKKLRMTSIMSLIEKYKYMYSDDEFNWFKQKYESLSTQWYLLKTMKSDYEKDIPKITCKVCLEVDVTVALIPCGHVFCNRCANNINECPNCRGEVMDFLRLYF